MLNKNIYKMVEFSNKDDMVVGRIWKDANNDFMHAEIVDNCITNINEINGVQEFLDEVDAFVNEVVST